MPPLDPLLPVFVVFCFILIFGVRLLLWKYAEPKVRNIALPVTALWFGVTEILAATGLLSDAEARPPRLAIVLLPIVALWIATATSRWAGDLARRVPLALLIGVQAFRVPVEIFLHLLHQRGLIPRMMTWEGANWDVVTGLTAPLIAVWILRGQPSRRILVTWNIAGLALLFNVVVRGILTAPGAFQTLRDDFPNVAVLQFPYVAIPAVFVSLAGALHLLSLRRLGKSR